MRPTLSTPILIAVVALGCGDGATSGGPRPNERSPATDYLVVETADGMALYGEVPLITIVEQPGQSALIDLTATAEDEFGERLWYLRARLRPADLIEGSMDETIYKVSGLPPTVAGMVNVMIETPVGGDEDWVREGTASMQRLDDGWFEGTIDCDDNRMAAKFKGGFRVTCSYLTPDGKNWIVDDGFTSEFCATYASVVPPDPGAAP